MDGTTGLLVEFVIRAVFLFLGSIFIFCGLKRLAGLLNNPHSLQSSEMVTTNVLKDFYFVSSRMGVREKPLLVVDASLTSGPNAYAWHGNGNDRGVVGLSPALLQMLHPSELRAVLAHELAHLGTPFAWWVLYLITVTHFSTAMGLFLLTLTPVSAESWQFIGGAVVLGLLMPAPYTLSRAEEFRADAVAARAMGEGESLASALEKIAPDSRGLPHPFTTHPATCRRTRRLRSMKV